MPRHICSASISNKDRVARLMGISNIGGVDLSGGNLTLLYCRRWHQVQRPCLMH